MKVTNLLLLAGLLLASCNKMAESILDKSNASPGQFVKYTIRAGQHYADKNAYKTIETGEMKFVVKFDSSAIYQTQSAANQYDINKLYGFSDNGKDHHQFSARFGWRWSDNALRLFAYVYNEGVVTSQELTTASLNQEISCSIRVSGDAYVFQVNDALYQVQRKSVTEKAKGYQLYPYFGGDEVAPHDIYIWIKE